MLFHKNPISRTTSTIFWFPWLLKIHKNHIDHFKYGKCGLCGSSKFTDATPTIVGYSAIR